jgi:hypothetical protein
MRTHPERFATTDHGAATLGIIVHQGDDYRERWRIVTLHLEPDGTYRREDADLTDVVFDSAIYDGQGDVVGAFTILDHSAGVIEVSLSAADTTALKVGTYSFWVDGGDTNAALLKTYVQGKLEVRRK